MRKISRLFEMKRAVVNGNHLVAFNPKAAAAGLPRNALVMNANAIWFGPLLASWYLISCLDDQKARGRGRGRAWTNCQKKIVDP